MIAKEQFRKALYQASNESPQEFIAAVGINREDFREEYVSESQVFLETMSRIPEDDLRQIMAAIAAVWCSGFQRGFHVANIVQEEFREKLEAQ